MADDCIHIHDPEGRDIGYICRGTGNHYRIYAHERGGKVYRQVGKPTRSAKVAIRRAGEELLSHQIYNRVAVALCADYYDPAFIYEVVRK